jgi:hypothetical protein
VNEIRLKRLSGKGLNVACLQKGGNDKNAIEKCNLLAGNEMILQQHQLEKCNEIWRSFCFLLLLDRQVHPGKNLAQLLQTGNNNLGIHNDEEFQKRSYQLLKSNIK